MLHDAIAVRMQRKAWNVNDLILPLLLKTLKAVLQLYSYKKKKKKCDITKAHKWEPFANEIVMSFLCDVWCNEKKGDAV